MRLQLDGDGGASDTGECESVRRDGSGGVMLCMGRRFCTRFSTPSDQRGDVVHIVECVALLHGMCSVRWDWNWEYERHCLRKRACVLIAENECIVKIGIGECCINDNCGFAKQQPNYT